MTHSEPYADSCHAINPAARVSLSDSVPPPPAAAGVTGSVKGIVVSDAAVAYAQQKLEARGTPGAAIRLGVRGGGCSGYQYVIEFSDEPPRERDRVFEVGGVRFVVDKKSLIVLAGSILDFEKTLMFQGFKFRNPNEATSCGCGHSFTVR
jgi:iron-sulfur cluster assembly protein